MAKRATTPLTRYDVEAWSTSGKKHLLSVHMAPTADTVIVARAVMRTHPWAVRARVVASDGRAQWSHAVDRGTGPAEKKGEPVS